MHKYIVVKRNRHITHFFILYIRAFVMRIIIKTEHKIKGRKAKGNSFYCHYDYDCGLYAIRVSFNK